MLGICIKRFDFVFLFPLYLSGFMISVSPILICEKGYFRSPVLPKGPLKVMVFFIERERVLKKKGVVFDY